MIAILSLKLGPGLGVPIPGLNRLGLHECHVMRCLVANLGERKHRFSIQLRQEG